MYEKLLNDYPDKFQQPISVRILFLIILGLMLSSALTAMLMRTLLAISIINRLLISISIIFLIAITFVPFISGIYERQHELRMANYENKQKLYYSLIDVLLNVHDDYQRYGCINIEDIILFIENYRTELFVYGSPTVIQAYDLYLQKAIQCICYSKSGPII